MIKNVYEILEELAAVSTRTEKARILKENPLYHFKEVLRYTFNPECQFYAEEFPKDYIKPNTFPGIRIAGIESEIRKAYLFLKGNPTADILTPEKRHVLLLQLIESFEPKEAEVWINMMNKDLKIKGLTMGLVKEVYPELF
jgi:hypothetical protein